MTIPVLIVVRDDRDTHPAEKSYLKLQQILKKVGWPHPLNFATAEYARENILALRPNLVVAMGGDALNAIYDTDHTLSRLRGEILEFQAKGPPVKIIATFHPNFVYKNWNNQEIIEYDFRKAMQWCNDRTFPVSIKERDYRVITDMDDAHALVDYLAQAERIAFDIETEGFDLFDKDEILCVQFACKDGEAFVLPLRGAWARQEYDFYSDWQNEQPHHDVWFSDENSGETYKVRAEGSTVLSHSQEKIVVPAFRKGQVICKFPEAHEKGKAKSTHICRGTLTNVLDGPLITMPQGYGRMSGKEVPSDYYEMVAIIKAIMTNNVQKVAHNGKFDVHGLKYQLGIDTRNFGFDTMLAYHNVHEVRPHNLEFVRSRYSIFPKYDDELKTYVTKGKKGSFAEIPNEILWEYGAADADLEWNLVKPLLEEIDRSNPNDGMWLFKNLDMPFNRALIQIEENGLWVDKTRFDQLVKIYADAIVHFKRSIDVLCEEHGISPLETYNNSHTLRPFLFELQYEEEVRPEKRYQHRPCKGTGCDECDGGTTLIENRITRPMKGCGFPVAIVPKSEKTAEESTGKRAFTALASWCSEKVHYRWVQTSNNAYRVPTEKALSEKEITHRLWKGELLSLITNYKKAVQAKNLFLDGDNKQKVDGAKAMLRHIKYDGRIHADYKQLTTTSRTSTSSPNLANITNDDDKEESYFFGKGIRAMFGAENE